MYKIIIIVALALAILLSLPKKTHGDVEASPVMEAKVHVPTDRDLLFEKIGECESNHVLTAKNKYSSASGEYQFIWGSWNYYGKKLWGKEFYKKNIWTTDNRELARYVFDTVGTSPWEASRKCWGKWDK